MQDYALGCKYTLNDNVQVGMGPLVQDVFHVFLICLL